jgi:glycine oxidase
MDVAIVGGGVIGLAVAWRAIRRGLTVTVIDPAEPERASAVSAGMLAPVSELTYGEQELFRLGLASRQGYGDFVAELEERTGMPTGYLADGALEVAYDADDLAVLAELRDYMTAMGVAVEAVDARECRRWEPMLAPGVRGGFYAPEDGSVDPRRLTAALRAAIAADGGVAVDARATDVVLRAGRAVGVRTEDGTVVDADRVVLAAGCWTRRIGGVPPEVMPRVRPVKGQILRLRGHLLRRTTRALVRGSSVYLVPRADGELVVGATQEERGFDVTPTAGGVWELLRDARELVPGITELAFAEVGVGLRPGSPDNMPLLGSTAVPGLLLATGHYRNGVLLAPLTGDVLADVLAGGELPDIAKPFAADRFTEQ